MSLWHREIMTQKYIEKSSDETPEELYIYSDLKLISFSWLGLSFLH